LAFKALVIMVCPVIWCYNMLTRRKN